MRMSYAFDKENITSIMQRLVKDKDQFIKELSLGSTPQEKMNLDIESMAKLYEAAYEIFASERYHDSVDAFLFLTTLNPANHDYWLGLGMSLQLIHEYEVAIDAYEMAAICSLESPVPYFYLAKCFFAIHERDTALKALDLAIENASENEEYLQLLEQALAAKTYLLKDG